MLKMMTEVVSGDSSGWPYRCQPGKSFPRQHP